MNLELKQKCLKYGEELVVRGDIARNAVRITFDLGPDDDNIALHLSVRFDENRIVLNSKQNGEWGAESARVNLFIPGGRFEVSIQRKDGFEVGLPENQFMTICDRLSLANIPWIRISGELEIADFILRKFT